MPPPLENCHRELGESTAVFASEPVATIRRARLSTPPRGLRSPVPSAAYSHTLNGLPCPSDSVGMGRSERNVAARPSGVHAGDRSTPSCSVSRVGGREGSCLIQMSVPMNPLSVPAKSPATRNPAARRTRVLHFRARRVYENLATYLLKCYSPKVRAGCPADVIPLSQPVSIPYTLAGSPCGADAPPHDPRLGPLEVHCEIVLQRLSSSISWLTSRLSSRRTIRNLRMVGDERERADLDLLADERIEPACNAIAAHVVRRERCGKPHSRDRNPCPIGSPSLGLRIGECHALAHQNRALGSTRRRSNAESSRRKTSSPDSIVRSRMP